MICIIEFINYIIKCSIILKKKTNILKSKVFLVSFNKFNKTLIFLFEDNFNIIVLKYQIYFLIYNTICYKYNFFNKS